MWFRRKRADVDEAVKDATASAAHPFSSDRAISSLDDDRLNRKGFAYAIADAVANWRQRDSLVLGIFGPWGVGKTSVVNMVKERLRSSTRPPLVVDFSPWEWAGHQELAEAFFEELEKGLAATHRRAALNVASKVRSYALALNASAALAQAVAPVVAAISVLVVVLGIGFMEFGDSAAKWGGRVMAGVGAGGVILAQSQAVMAPLADYLERRSPKPRLSDVKKELADSLKQYSRTIVVIVDDIDRLTPADAVRMLQIVKANADLPGVVFVVACDQDAVAKAVRVSIGVDGRGYLEKVVQVGFDVPSPDAAELGQLLVDGINKATQAEPISARFDQGRWRDIYLRGLLPYLTTPRRVTRFTAMTEFGLARYIDESECNVDPVDFIGIEALREFEPEVYAALRNSKDAVTGMTSGDSHLHREKAEVVGSLLAVARASKQSKAAEQLLRDLFPAVEWAVSDVGQIIDRDRQLEDRRVGHERTFDRYFQFTVPTNDLSDGEVTRTVDLASGSKDDLVEALRKLMATGHMVVLLVRLQAAPDKIPAGAEATLMAALFDLGDELPNRVETLLDISELLLAEFLVESLLERRPVAERVPLFREAMDASTGIVLPIEVVRLQMHRHKRERSPAIAKSDLEELLSALVHRVVAATESGALLNHRHLAPLLYAWDEVEPGAPRPWTEAQAGSPAGLARLITAFDRHAREDGQHPLVRFIDLDAAKERARQWLDDSELDAGEREAFEALLAPADGWETVRAAANDHETEPEVAAGNEAGDPTAASGKDEDES